MEACGAQQAAAAGRRVPVPARRSGLASAHRGGGRGGGGGGGRGGGSSCRLGGPWRELRGELQAVCECELADLAVLAANEEETCAPRSVCRHEERAGLARKGERRRRGVLVTQWQRQQHPARRDHKHHLLRLEKGAVHRLCPVLRVARQRQAVQHGPALGLDHQNPLGQQHEHGPGSGPGHTDDAGLELGQYLHLGPGSRPGRFC